MTESTGTGPDPETIVHHIQQTYPDTDVVTIEGGWFFSVDPEKHWPNFATLVTNDDYDTKSQLTRPGVFRLNLGVGKETFLRLVGDQAEPDYVSLDQVFPHPDYAAQRWISILNPSQATFDDLVRPLLDEAHARVVRQFRLKRGELPTFD
jgi:hypothetical protein